MGVYLSLEFLGVSTTSCVSLLDKTVGKAAELRRRSSHERPADYYSSLARESARPLDQLVLKQTGELSAADIAKGWCLLRFLAQGDGERGHEALHSACKLSREKPSFLEAWREQLRWLYAVSEGDPIRALERLALPAAKK